MAEQEKEALKSVAAISALLDAILFNDVIHNFTVDVIALLIADCPLSNDIAGEKRD